MSGRQHITDENRGHFTILLNLMDVWRDQHGTLLEPWAIRVYFHFARLCGTSREGHAEESTRETASNCEISLGLAHKARVRLADTGWITLEYSGTPGHETAYITLVDRWAENSAYWAKFKRPRSRDGLRSYSERKLADTVGVQDVNASVHENGVCVHESSESVNAKNVPSSSPELRPEDRKNLKTGDGAAAQDSGSEIDDETERSLAYRVQQVAQDLGDPSVAACISHARSVLARSQLEWYRFDSLCKRAWRETTQRVEDLSKPRVQTPMAYFFSVLETLVGSEASS